MRGFREIREIKNPEVKKVVDKKKENYKQIKPETNITKEEAMNFWNEMFATERES